MSWITDANDKVNQDRKREEIQEAEQINLFHQMTDRVKAEIVEVLAEASRQGLRVSDPQEGFFSFGHYIEEEIYYFNRKGSFQHYMVYWTVSEPNTNPNKYTESIDIRLTAVN